jgi:protoporphyrinogen oxidase
LEVIYEFLEKFGLPRQANEFNANFAEMNQSNSPANDLFLVGRFAQWNYYWTHDCAKKAKEVAHQIVNRYTATM